MTHAIISFQIQFFFFGLPNLGIMSLNWTSATSLAISKRWVVLLLSLYIFCNGTKTNVTKRIIEKLKPNIAFQERPVNSFILCYTRSEARKKLNICLGCGWTSRTRLKWFSSICSSCDWKLPSINATPRSWPIRTRVDFIGDINPAPHDSTGTFWKQKGNHINKVPSPTLVSQEFIGPRGSWFSWN